VSCHLLGIDYYLPDSILTNDDLVRINPGWDAEKIFKKTRIRSRAIAPREQTAADLGFLAAEKLLDRLDFDRGSVDALIFCTQSPDYFLPSSACLLQDRLGLPNSCGAFDFNLGCSGFTYGLWLARSLILSGSAANVLLITADTYSRYCDLHDLSTVSIFGDGGAATLLSASPANGVASILGTVVGTDGRGAENLIVRGGCARNPRPEAGAHHLVMKGPEILSFTLSTVRDGIDRLLRRTGLAWDEVDHFLFHQANGFMLDRLGMSMGIDPARMPIDLEFTGNTVSASIPILMAKACEAGRFEQGDTCVLAGFGVGYSWAMTLVEWGGSTLPEA
jgi:3-oxoacyl-[acyl-carrier-protein] synthase-3